MAARALALLPLAGVAAWSANATLTRMSHQVRAPPGGEALEFIPGSMDDTIMETLETGDVVFFQRKLTAMQPLAALHTWVTRLQLRPRFDHCGWIYVDRLGRKFIVEETLDKVQCRPYSARLLTSEATEISVLTLKLERSKEMQEAANAFIAQNLGRTSRISLRHTVSALISPDEMRKADPEAAPAFPSAAFVAEAYNAMGLANKNQLTSAQPPLSAATVTPRDFASSKIRLQAPNGAKPPAFGRLLPIRLE
ncbi:mitochondrial carrier [Phytophthora cinnamomi]|uniref:mitochondrial carrier n=1 Tax=Phytophthora cinnamomi TaxID=4785 RepID=UPI00355A1D2C|nr:mitochondrial carrier [Phytophthora cinnamomi]